MTSMKWGAAVGLLLMTLIGCNQAGLQGEKPVPTKVEVTPIMTTLSAIGDTVQVAAKVLDQNGQVMAEVSVTWKSSDASVASVDTSGLVTAVGKGSATITASSGTAAASATITVAPDLSLAFVEDSVRVTEGEESVVSIRYRVLDLASPKTIQISVLEDTARAADYELSETRFEIPAGKDLEGTLELVVSALADDAFAEGRETIKLRLVLPDADGAAVGGALPVTILDAPVSACAGVTLAGTPPAPVAEVQGRIRTSLTSEWLPSAREVTMRWVGPYGGLWGWGFDIKHHPYYDERAKPFPPQPDFRIDAWEFDTGSSFTTHEMDVSWSAEADLELMFRCGTVNVVATCDSEGCKVQEMAPASSASSGGTTALQSALWGKDDGVVSSAGRAAAYLVDPDRRWHPSVWKPGETLVFYLSTENWPKDAEMTPADAKEVLERMLAEWSEIPTADISWQVEGPVDGLLPRRDGKNIFWIDPGYEHGRSSVTSTWYETIDGIHGKVEADHRIDPNSVRRPKRSYDRPWGYLVNELGMHPLGHTLGLEHAATFPVYRPCPTGGCGRAEGDLDYWRGVSGAYQLDPIMSYGVTAAMSFMDDGSSLRLDDEIGASLLRPKPGWLETTGSIAGSVRIDDGRPGSFVHVWAVRPDEHGLMDGTGAFADRNGNFLIRGLPPGDWILIAHPDQSWLANPWFFFERQGELTDEMMLFPVRASAGQTTSGIEITMSRGRKTTVHSH